VTVPQRPALRWAGALAALALLNFALTFDNLWPTLWIRPRWALSVELAVLVLLLAAAIGRWGPPSRRALSALGAGLVVLAAGRYVEVTAREMYGRPINLYYDVPHVPEVIAMFAQATPGWLVAVSVLAVLLAFAGAFVLLRWAAGRLGEALALRAVRRPAALCAGVACVAFALGAGAFTPPVTASYARQAALLAQALGGGGRALGDSPEFGTGLARVDGADVFVVFVESYGAATYDRPMLRERLAADRAALSRAAEETGRTVVSALVESPTFGGASWLAHASLLTGVEVRDGDSYNLLTLQRRASLVGEFARAGYRTVALMPGLRQDWREGAALYGFDAIYDAARLDYRGPAFGWWRIPDQYALGRLDRAEVMPRERAPLFVFFPTITSHAPFRPLPPYQPDWDRLLSDAPFDPATLPPRVPPSDEWRDLEPAYGDAIGYALATLAGYLRERRAADLVLVVVGDHQPPAGVAGEGASWAVPVHVVASRRAILDVLLESGFAAGLEPRRPALARMHELTPMLLRAFGADPPGIDVAGPVARPQAIEKRPQRVGL
jgi:hypothetical protein